MTSVLDVLRDRGYGDVDEAALVRAVQDVLPTREKRYTATYRAWQAVHGRAFRDQSH